MTRLYLVDDHAIVRDGLRALLEDAGHHVVGEGSEPREILGELAGLGPELLLLDLNLGGRSGFELLGEFRKRGLSIPVLVLSMSDHPRHVAEAVRSGVAGYLLKSAPRHELIQAIEVVCKGKRYFSPEVAELAMRGLTRNHESELLATLSPREQQIITMVVNGQTSKVIAEQLHLASKTVDIYRSRIMRKLGVDGIASLVRLAIRNGLIDSTVS